MHPSASRPATPIHEMTALELGSLIARREAGVVEVTRAALQRITANDSRFNAFLTLCEESALAQAAAVQQRLDAGEKLPPLAGVPMAVKDNISTRGIRTTCGSRMLWNYVPPFDATVIERIKAGGAVILGKTNLDEFAMGSTTETSYGGVTRNPWATDRVPGGSSGGSAAAVAGREAWYALGSDTGGSIRQPCAFCGLTGLKPTYGTVSRYGLVAYASSLDQIGPIARTAADCAAILAQFVGPDERDSTVMPGGSNLDPTAVRVAAEALAAAAATNSAAARTGVSDSLRGLKIGVPNEYFTEGLQVDSDIAILQAAAVLERLGASLEYFSLPLVEEAIPAYYLIATAEASANLARYDGIQYGYRPDESQVGDLTDFYCQARTAGFGREVRRRIILGTFALSSGYYDAYYLKALRVRRLVQESFREALSRYDLLLAPVAPATAPRIGDTLADPLRMYLSDVFTVAANLTGLPALALPCGLDGNRLPIGFQLIGPAFADIRLLQAGAAFQLATDFHRLQPPAQEVPT
jgi:aspartyl-tRNA(Asn)/glutamyl-tRNA(Gln) amidotransferase subunit A